MVCLSGDRIKGSWVAGEATGWCEMHYANCDVFKGEVRDRKPHGEGKLLRASRKQFQCRASYEGAWLKGAPHGEGVQVSESGAEYKGGFKHGKKSGYGVWVNKNESFEGHWKGGLKDGEGTFRYSNGDVYQGEWRNNHLSLIHI